MYGNTPIWTQAGLAHSQYRDLPWPEKRRVLYRYCGRPIHHACWECGDVIRWKRFKEWKDDFGVLIHVYLKNEKEINEAI